MSGYNLISKLRGSSRRRLSRLLQKPKGLSNIRFYSPLLERLSKETGLSIEKVYIELVKEITEYVKDNSLNL